MNSLVYTCSATLAGVSANLVTTPMWVLRVRYQTEYMYSEKNKKESFNLLKALLKIYNKEGFRALYRGLLIELIGTPQVIIQFNLYEYMNKYFKKQNHNKDIEYKYILVSSVLSKSNIYL